MIGQVDGCVRHEEGVAVRSYAWATAVSPDPQRKLAGQFSAWMRRKSAQIGKNPRHLQWRVQTPIWPDKSTIPGSFLLPSGPMYFCFIYHHFPVLNE